MDLTVHVSDMLTFKRCRQRWDFSSNLRMNLEPKYPIPALWLGTAVHIGLATYYDPQYLERSPERALQAFRDYITNWLALGDKDDIQRKEFAAELSVLGLGMLDNYCRWAPKHDRFDVIAVEVPFLIPIPGMAYTHGGKWDALIWLWDYKKFGIMEHKTTQQFPEDTEWLMIDDQCGKYLWAGHQRGIPIEFVLYNELKKKVPVPLAWLQSGRFSINRSQDTTYELALSQIKEVYDGRVPKFYHEYLYWLRDEKPNNFVRRINVRRNATELANLGQALRYEVLDMINNPAIYRSPSRINCQGCPFISPCMAKWEGSDYEWILQHNFQERA